MGTKIKNIPFVGGDTMTFEFDFGTKVAKSVAECPMKLYGSYTSSLQVPSNITGVVTTGWVEEPAQAQLDKIKSQDNTCLAYSSTGNGIIAQMMVELDLTQLCTTLFGGSTSAMSAACKNIITDVYAKGSGSNNGTKANGVVAKRWYNNTGVWSSIALNENDTSDILNMHNEDTRTDGTKTGFFASNKFYLLIYAKYPSDGTIPSEVDLDYINIKLQFSRVPDVIAPIPITLPDTWSLLIKGFSPAWDGSSTAQKYLWQVANSTDNANYEIYYLNNKFTFLSWNGSSSENLNSDTLTFNKFQTFNLLLEQTSSGLRMRILQNTSSTKKYTLNSSRNFAGDKQMSILQHLGGSHQADAFVNSLIFLPNKVFDDDTEAESILRGTAEGFEEDELFDISKVTTSSSVSKTSNSVTVNGTSAYQGVWNLYIPVLPNNRYHIHCEYSDTSIGMLRIDEFYNNINLSTSPASGTPTDVDITVGSKTNNIKFVLTNKIAGTVTFSNISLKLKM